MIFLKLRLKISTQLLDILHEVRVDVCLASANPVIVLDKTAACRFLHNVQHLLTLAHTIYECRECAKVLCAAAVEQQMAVDTLQLVHYCTDILDAVRQFHAHSLLYHRAEGMAVHHRAQIVHTVCQGQSLRIGVAFAHLLYSAVYVSAVRIYLLYGLSLKHCLQAEHSMRGRVLRTDVDDIVVGREQRTLLLHNPAVIVKAILNRIVRLRVVSKHVRVVFRAHVIVLAERISLEIGTQIKPAHILMPYELYSEEIINLTLEQFGSHPQAANRGYIRLVAVCVYSLDTDALMRNGVLKNIYTSESFLAEVFSNYRHKEVKTLLFLQFRHLFGKNIQFELYVF